MENKDNILTELKAICPALFAAQRVNVFTVPDGYFNNLSNVIIETISSTTYISDDASFNTELKMPKGYFDDLANNILQKINTLQSAAANDTDEENSDLLIELSKENILEVPVDYFDSVSKNILAKINRQESNTVTELQNIAPLLNSFSKENMQEIPVGYFDNLYHQILEKTIPIPGKVVKMPSRFSFINYAAAALVIGVISTTIYYFSSKPVAVNNNDYATLDSSIQKGKTMNETRFNETLNNLTAEDIAEYLQKNGTEADVSMLSSSIDENIVPAEDEYLLNEKTLDNFLKEIETQPSKN